MTVPTGHKEFWGDGSGGAKAVTAAFVAGTSVSVYGDSELVLNLLGAGTAATFYELRMMLARPGSTDWQALPVVYGSTASAEIVEQEALIIRVAGSNGNHPIVLKTPPNMQVRIDIRRNGGAADTTALLTGYVREVVGESSISSLSIAAGATLTQDVNVEEIAGSTTPATTVAGKMPCEDDIRQIAGQNVASTGLNGTMPIEGTAANDAAADASNPVKVGGVATAADDSVDEGDNAHLSFDLALYQRIVSKAFDSLTTSDQVTNLNTIATDRDSDAQVIADESNIAAGNNYYPSSAGYEIGSRTNLGAVIDITQIDLDVEISNDGTTWVNATKTLFDIEQGSSGFDNTHYTEAAGGSATFLTVRRHHREQ